MSGYRVTKYDPAQRDQGDRLLVDDWTSVSDVGKTFNGKILSTEEYLRSENLYVEAAKSLTSLAMIRSLRVKDLETRTEAIAAKYIDDGVAEACRAVQNGQIVSGREFENIVRGCLREYIWCRLAGARQSYIHFGYDYYMYVGLPKTVRLPVLPRGIFVEDFESPYSDGQ